MTVDRRHQRACNVPIWVSASDHEDRIARGGMVSRFRRLNASGGVEIKLGCRSTVFVIPILRRCAWRQPGTRWFEVDDLARNRHQLREHAEVLGRSQPGGGRPVPGTGT